MSDQDSRSRARARLALRAERAFGLTSVPRRAVQAEPEQAREALVAPALPPVAPVVRPFKEKPSPSTRPQVTPQPQLLPTDQPFTAPVLPPAQKLKVLQELDANEVKGCTRCRLCETRTNTVFGEGDHDAQIFFIGEGPGENEDLQGRPFVGRAGDLLNRMIAGMGLKREQVFIANIVKCRPPGNREPAPDEVAACTPYLQRQIEIIRPRVIVTLGKPAMQHMLQSRMSISKVRGQWQTWRGIKLMPTFHPAYILRNYTEETRAAVWSDLKQVMAEIGLPQLSKKAHE